MTYISDRLNVDDCDNGVNWDRLTSSMPLFLSLLLFPVYFYVSWKNKEKDKEALIFPITNHFFKVITITHILLYSLICSVIIFLFGKFILMEIDIIIFQLIMVIFSFNLILITFLSITTYLITSAVCTLLIIFLAAQRFLIYFFPKVGGFLSPKRPYFFVFLYISTPFFYIFPIFSLFANMPVVYFNSKFQTNIPNLPDPNPTIFTIMIFEMSILYILTFLCSILYLIMIRKIKKFKEMMSQTTIKPENYIMYQVIILSVSQLSMIILAFCYHRFDDCPWRMEVAVLNYFGIHSMNTFPVIQVAYLFCNRANLQEMKKLFKRVLRMKAEVEPVDSLSALRSTSDAS